MSSRGEGEDARVRSAVDGDGEALEGLLRDLGPRVAAGLVVDSRWRPSLEPEDVMQVTYLEAYLRISTLRATSAAGFRGWLARIAENNLRDAVRALERDKRPDARRRVARTGGTSAETLMATLTDGRPTAGSIAAGREAISRLRGAIDRLPESYRRVVEGVDLAERPASEIAREMGRSPGAIHMLRSRAHDRLRELLGSPTRVF